MPTSKQPVPEQSVEERLVKEIRFDPDAWIVETEDRAGRHFLDLARDLKQLSVFRTRQRSSPFVALR